VDVFARRYPTPALHRPIQITVPPSPSSDTAPNPSNQRLLSLLVLDTTYALVSPSPQSSERTRIQTTAEVTNAITRALFSSFRLFDSIFSKHLYPISITMHISHIFCLPSSCPGAMLQYNALSFESTSQRSASRVRQRTVYTSGSDASQSCVPPALLASTGMSARTYRDPLVSSFRLVAAISTSGKANLIALAWACLVTATPSTVLFF
jgi:hypothetical protein